MARLGSAFVAEAMKTQEELSCGCFKGTSRQSDSTKRAVSNSWSDGWSRNEENEPEALYEWRKAS